MAEVEAFRARQEACRWEAEVAMGRLNILTMGQPARTWPPLLPGQPPLIPRAATPRLRTPARTGTPAPRPNLRRQQHRRGPDLRSTRCRASRRRLRPRQRQHWRRWRLGQSHQLCSSSRPDRGSNRRKRSLTGTLCSRLTGLHTCRQGSGSYTQAEPTGCQTLTLM
jgi:hypothetical protein